MDTPYPRIVDEYCGNPVVQLQEHGRRFVDKRDHHVEGRIVRVGYVWDIGNVASYDKHEWHDVTNQWNGISEREANGAKQQNLVDGPHL